MSVRRRVRWAVVALLCATAFGIFRCYLYFGTITCCFPHAAEDKAQTGARVLRMAVRSWQASTSSASCPNLAQLKSERYLDPDQTGSDPWGTVYRISCANDEVTVSSAGPDQRWETRDDISVPRMRQ